MWPDRAWERAVLEIRGEAQGTGQRHATALGALPPSIHADHRGRPPPSQLLPHGLSAQVDRVRTSTTWLEAIYRLLNVQYILKI